MNHLLEWIDVGSPGCCMNTMLITLEFGILILSYIMTKIVIQFVY